MHKLVENITSGVLAIILALLVWVAAVQEQNPIVRGVFPDPIPIEFLNKPSDLDFVNPAQVTEYVQLTIRAPQSSWDSLTASSFQAVVDLKGLSEGTHVVDIEITCSDPRVRIVSEQPAQLTIRLEPMLERVFEVKVRLMDDPALGYEARTPTVDPPTVKVTGPASAVNQVQTVVAEVFLRRSKTTVTSRVTVIALDATDNPVSMLTSISPSQVTVTVPIEQKLGYRDVSVSVIRKGQVARGYRITGITVEPSIVTVVGSPAALAALPGYVETMPVDIDGATSDVKVMVGLVLPEGVSIVGSQTVSVTVSIAPIIDSVTLDRPVVIQGLATGFTATASPNKVDVIISGPVPKLESLKSEDVRVVVDLFGLTPGVYKVTPVAFAPDGLVVESILPDTIEVEIKAPSGVTTSTPRPTASVTPTPTATTTPTATPSPKPTVQP